MDRKNTEHWQEFIKNKSIKNVTLNTESSISDSSKQQHVEQQQDQDKCKIDGKGASYKIKVYVNEKGTVTLTPSNKPLATILFAINDSVYDVRNNEWRLSCESYGKVRKTLKAQKFLFSDIPNGVLKTMSKQIVQKHYELRGEIYDKMFVFQREAVKYALHRGGRVILGDDMGLGKTIQALGIAYHYRQEWPVLIISPASLVDNWDDAVHTFLKVDSKVIRCRTDFGASVSIISYDLSSKYADIIKILNYNVIIVDECHYIKSTTSKRTKNLLPFLQNASRIILMSGTPAVSRPLELYTIFLAIDKHLFPNFTEYGMRYCNGRKIKHWYDYKGCSNAEELNYILTNYYMVRRLKDEVLSQLPPKTRRQIVININKKVEIKNSNLVGDNVEQNIMLMYRDAASSKLEPVCLYIDTVLEKKIKFIIFAHHSVMIDGIEKHLCSKKVKYIKIDGSVVSANRYKLVQTFQNDDSTQVALLSITACSTGLTLTSGKLVVFAELYWNPGTLLQAEDRIHRIGQNSSVDIHYIVCKGTIDEYVWPVLIKKLNVLQSLGLGTTDLKNTNVSNYDTKQSVLDSFMVRKNDSSQ